jgi:hypothetical protein
MDFDYPYQEGPDSYVDILDVNGGTLYLRDQSETGRAVFYQNSNYHTILSAVIFGAVRGAQREALIEKYIQYLTFGTGVVEEKNKTFDITGRTIAEWELESGNNKMISWNLQGRSEEPIPTGTYFVRMMGSGISVTQSFVILR